MCTRASTNPNFLLAYSVTQEVTQVNTEKIKLLTQSIEEIGKVRSQIDTLVLQANQAQLKGKLILDIGICIYVLTT